MTEIKPNFEQQTLNFDLNDDEKQEILIKSEIIDFIHADMKILNQKDIDDEKLMEKNKNLDDILNYNGEKIILTKNEESKVKNIPDKNKKKMF